MSTPRILIVEDEPMLAKTLQNFLEGAGYEIPFSVPSGEQAIERALEIRPDLVLMDIRLAGQIDGTTAALRIRENLDAAIVYISAYSDDATLADAKQSIPDGYLIKPFTLRQLETVIEMALEKRRSMLEWTLQYQWLMAALDNLDIGLAITDTAGRTVFMNAFARDVASLTTVTLQSPGVGNATRDKTPGMARAQSRLKPGEPIRQYQLSDEALDSGYPVDVSGELEACCLCAAPVKSATGQIMGTVYILLDALTIRRMHSDLSDEQRQKIQRSVSRELVRKIEPILGRLRDHDLPDPLQRLVGILESHLGSVADSTASDLAQQLVVLTPRELQICDMLDSGLSSKEMAEELGVSTDTVRFHRKNIRKKLRLKGSAISVPWFLRRRLQT